MRRFVLILLVLFILSGAGFAQGEFDNLKKNITEFTLSNGLKFILLEDHSVPIASFVTYVNAGSVDERIGIYGISHFLEHMAFRGTSEVGTKDFKAEQKLFREMDALFGKILAEKGAVEPDQEKIKALEQQLETFKKEAADLVEDNEYHNILKRQGAQGINAGTGADATVYFYSLPSNKIELWAYMESSRFTDPVYREFYKERGVIQEERRVRTENTPTGKLIEEILAIAFHDHPYRVNGIGPMSNIDNITRADLYNYFRTNYTASNMVIGVTGDVYPDQLKKMANKYFARMRTGRRNPRILTNEPKQKGEKTITLYEDSQPVLVMGYHIPSQLHEDFVKLSVLSNILSGGRSSRLKKRLEIDEKKALTVGAFAGFPGTKYSCLFVFLGIPNSGFSNDDILKVLEEEIEKIKTEGVTQEELDAAKTRYKVSIIRALKSNRGLLMGLMQSEMIEGAWQKGFDSLAQLQAVTLEDIREMAKKYFYPNNRTIGRIEKQEEKKEDKKEKKEEAVK